MKPFPFISLSYQIIPGLINVICCVPAGCSSAVGFIPRYGKSQNKNNWLELLLLCQRNDGHSDDDAGENANLQCVITSTCMAIGVVSVAWLAVSLYVVSEEVCVICTQPLQSHNTFHTLVSVFARLRHPLQV